LLRHDRIYRGARAWTLAYRRWLTTVRFAHPAQRIVLQDYIHAVQDAEARLDRLTQQIEELLSSHGCKQRPQQGHTQAAPGSNYAVPIRRI
jgi:hypothetical protein